MTKAAKDVDSYIAAAPKDVQGKLKQLRKAIRDTAPMAVERISYGMPYYEHNGIVVAFAHYKNHIGLYPVSTELNKELKPYAAAKATARFPLDQQLPIGLIKKVVKARMKQNEAKTTKRETERARPRRRVSP